jgi:hypothetical protein
MRTGSKSRRLLSRAAEFNFLPGIIFILLLLKTLPCTSRTFPGSNAISDTGMISRLTVDERVLLITDRNIYLCGEEIVFEAFTYEGTLGLPFPSAKILYAELYSTDNNVIARGKYILRDGRGSGSITIPRETSSGIYLLRAYTNFMKNSGYGQFFVMKLKIVNPFLGGRNIYTLPGGLSDNDSIADRPEERAEKLKIALETERKEYGNREKIIVKIKATNKDGVPVKTDLTLFSVLAEGTLADPAVDSRAPFAAAGQQSEKAKSTAIRYLPEIKGDIISGRAVYEDNKPASGVEVLQSFTGSATRIESSVTDGEGRFFFLTDMEKNRGNLILKVKDDQGKIRLMPENEFFDDFPPPLQDTFSLTKEEIQLVSKEFINIQVDDAFRVQNSVREEETEIETAFYGKDFTEYKFPDYLKLPNMKEFIFEVIEGVIYSRENRRDIISIYEKTTMNKIGPDPLMVIDGVPVTDASLILGLPSEKVQSIRVVRNKYLYKDLIFDGIIDIVTFRKDASSFKLQEGTFRFNFIHPEMGQVKEELHIRQDENGKIPLYKNLLYWDSGITTDGNGNAEVSFLSPDNTGKFRITCFGFSAEGIFGTQSTDIIIGENQKSSDTAR